MAANAISLKRGAHVACAGQEWVIEAPEGLSRVLARSLSSGEREFLQISELLPVGGTGALATASEEDEDAVDGDGDQAPPRQLSWREKLMVDRIPVLPDERHWTAEDRKAVRLAVKEFEALVDALDAPKQDAGQAMQRVAELMGYGLSTAYRRRQIVLTWQCADALLRKVRSDAGTTKLSKEQLAIIDDNLEKFRFVENKRTVPKVLDLINGDLRRADPPLPEISRSTLFRRIHDLKTRKEQLESEGRFEEARNRYRTKAGHLPDADYPLSVVEIDHTPMPVILLDEEERKPIGKAWLSLVIDCYSRMVLGFHLSLDAPSTLSVGIAMAHALLPKDEYLKRVGVRGDWPCWGVPDVILVDNGADLNGRMVHQAKRFYRFNLRNRPVGLPQLGGHVESAFKTFMGEAKATPGTTRSNPKDRAEYDSEGNAKLTIAAFERLFCEFIVNDYHKSEHSGEGMNRRTPLQRWTQGILYGDIFPPTGLPPVPSDPLHLKLTLMPIERRSIDKGCVELFSNRYYSPELERLGLTVDLNKPLDARLFEVRYDPRNIYTVWVRDPSTGKYISANAQGVKWTYRSLIEHRAIRKNLGRPADEYKDDRYESIKRREQIKAEEVKKTKQVRREQAKRKRDEEGALPSSPSPQRKPALAPRTDARPMDPERLREIRSKIKVKIPGG
jgi:putative transposase